MDIASRCLMGITGCAALAAVAMSITMPRTCARRAMAITQATRIAQQDDGHQGRELGSVDEVVEVIPDDLADDGPVDDADLARGGVAESVGGEAIDVAEATGAGLVEDRDGVARERVVGAGDGADAVIDVLGRVLWRRGTEMDAGVYATQERAIPA